MCDFVLMTDSDTEIPYTFAEKYDIPVFLMPYTIDGEERLFDLGRETDFEGFYNRLREGADAFTSTRPPEDIADFYREILKTGKDILYLAFSSQLSSHVNHATMAKEEVLKEFPERRIVIVDTLRIAMGAGILVYYAAKMKEEGGTLDEIAEWTEKNKLRANAWFSVDNLMFLKKGGRLSGTQAVMGTLMDIKPILTINTEGKIVNVDKVKGTKKVIRYLIDKIQNNVEDEAEQICVVQHAGVPDRGRELKEKIENSFHFREVWLMDIGPVIGCHTGPGALSVLFMGKVPK